MKRKHPQCQIDVEMLGDTPPWDWPEGAGNLFKKLLRDPRAKESNRLIAADLAGNPVVIDDELALLLLAVTGSASESEPMRAKAVISLGPVLEQTDTDGFDDPIEDPPITLRTFQTIQRTLRTLYLDTDVPKEVRRRVLEASVRSPEDWHRDAIRSAYASGDRDWVLTAVFGMVRIRGLDEQILQALESPDPEIHFEAVMAAGNWELAGAWQHVVSLVGDQSTPKPLLFAAIEAVGSIRPREAGMILADLADSDDEEIAEVANDAISMAMLASDDEDESEDDEDDDDDKDGAKWLN